MDPLLKPHTEATVAVFKGPPNVCLHGRKQEQSDYTCSGDVIDQNHVQTNSSVGKSHLLPHRANTHVFSHAHSTDYSISTDAGSAAPPLPPPPVSNNLKEEQSTGQPERAALGVTTEAGQERLAKKTPLEACITPMECVLYQRGLLAESTRSKVKEPGQRRIKEDVLATFLSEKCY
ncbi:unnamed protein product [Leuciscus chuanchicus]